MSFAGQEEREISQKINEIVYSVQISQNQMNKLIKEFKSILIMKKIKIILNSE